MKLSRPHEEAGRILNKRKRTNQKQTPKHSLASKQLPVSSGETALDDLIDQINSRWPKPQKKSKQPPSSVA